jgi:hypothetical protein
VDQNITIHATILHTLKENLVMAQNHMKRQEEQGRFETKFFEGDQVFLHLKPYK